MSEETRVLPAVTDEVAKAVLDSMSIDDIRAALAAGEKKQVDATAAEVAAQTAAEKLAAEKLAAEVVVETPFKRTETVGGRDFEFEASTELELERMINNALKVAYVLRQDVAEPVVPAVDPTVAQAAAVKAAADEAVAKVELEQKFRLGEISPAEYIERSGAMRDYLASQGVPLESLKAAVERNADDAEAQSWADAVPAFLNGPAGSDWPGGDRNLQLINDKIISLGLVDAKDKVAAFAQAWEVMKSTNSFFPYEEPAAAIVVPAAVVVPPAAVVTPAAVVVPPAAVVVPKVAATSSSLFGVSSGVGGSAAVTPAAVAGAIEIPANATPTEIMDAYKKGLTANGVHPDAQFKETYRNGRV